MCGRCIDTCGRVMAGKGKTGLIGYSFGVTGVEQSRELIRPATATLFAICLFTLSLFVYQSVTRSSFEFSVLSHPMEARQSKNGDILNGYILSIKNKRQGDIYLRLTLATEIETSMVFTHNVQEALTVGGGLVDKYPLFVRSKGKPKEDLQLNITLTADGKESESRMKSAYFNLPE